MHPNSKSQSETGSRQQKYFLSKSNELFSTGNMDKPIGAGCQSRYYSCLFWVTTLSLAYSCLSRHCRRHLILMEQANFLKIYFGNSLVLFYNTSLTSVIFLQRKISLHSEIYMNLIKTLFNDCIISDGNVNNSPYMLKTQVNS